MLIKEAVESLLRNFKTVRIKKNSLVDRKIHKSIIEDGIATIPNFLDDMECKSFRDEIDRQISNDSVNVWVDSDGADNRIYFADKLNLKFEEFYNNPTINAMLSAYTGLVNPVGMLLAARIDYKSGNLGSGGGWHRDSPITHQFKAICYLNDVSSENGPFQYIKASHRKSDVIRSYFTRLFKPGQYRFSDMSVENYLSSNSDRYITDLTAPKGTLVFADTKGIHRGKPIASGSRYVLFCYFWDKNIPENFNRLRQNKI